MHKLFMNKMIHKL